MNIRIASVVIAIVMGVLSGCAGGTNGGGECRPGESVACDCSGGGSGTKTCNDDGTGFGSCGGCSATPDAGSDSGPRPDSGGAFCGDHACNDGETCTSCPSDCGTCAPTCSVTVGNTCTTDAQCCPDEGIATYCTGMDGAYACHATCSTDSDCESGCCTTRTDGVRVCAASTYCGPTCTVDVGGTCSADSQCCPESGDPTYCTGELGTTVCRAACSVNSDCTSGCCVARTDGVRICSDASYCDPCAVNGTCASCSAASNCGWCEGSSTCRTGTSTGSNDGVCYGTGWAWISSECR